MANLDSIKSHKRPAHLLIDEGPSRAAVGPRAELIIYVYQYTFGNLNFRFFFLHCRVSVEQQKQKVIQLLPHKSEIQTCNLQPATYSLHHPLYGRIHIEPHAVLLCEAFMTHDSLMLRSPCTRLQMDSQVHFTVARQAYPFLCPEYLAVQSPCLINRDKIYHTAAGF